jgi:hypothetical protein
MRTRVGRSVEDNDITIIISVATLVVLIDKKLAQLRDERPNDADTQKTRDGAIAHYERVKRDIEALRDVAFKVKQGKVEEKAVTKASTTFMQGVQNWWERDHLDISSKAYDATIFVSCVSLCALAGCGGTAAVVLSGVLAGRKPVIDALKALPRRLFG